jgi:hypothetical protein
VCNDGNNCYVADYMSNFASIITVGKEIVDLHLQGFHKKPCSQLHLSPGIPRLQSFWRWNWPWHWFSSPLAAFLTIEVQATVHCVPSLLEHIDVTVLDNETRKTCLCLRYIMFLSSTCFLLCMMNDAFWCNVFFRSY